MSWTLQHVSEHNSAQVIIHSKVYDVTEFLPEHPGGASAILEYAGKDATAAYDLIHPLDSLVKNLPKEKHLGKLNCAAAKTVAQITENRVKTKDEQRIEKAQREKAPLSRVLNLHDMEAIARKVMPYKALAYYSSASDEEITHGQNSAGFSRLFFLPRVMRPISKCDPSTTLLSTPSRIPIFISPAGLAGEANLTRGAYQTGIIQCVSSSPSLSYKDIADARPDPAQVLWFQLYKNKDNKKAEERVREVVGLWYKAIVLTVDAVVYGNRERDVRAPWVLKDMEKAETGTTPGVEVGGIVRQPDDQEELPNLGGSAGALVAHDDRDMTWEKTMPWLKKLTTLPVMVKGIQCVADAVLAAEAGVDGIVISNHGEYAMPSIEVLYRLRKQRPDIFGTIVTTSGLNRIRLSTAALSTLSLQASMLGPSKHGERVKSRESLYIP
ncbi:FMN-linked oxidoreductase [Athelia psychrophila]|uniref:FMN-linked oxidoreductase n=1 Tax=Athelia psychrophila TaxID=1759441 RepID=A0A167UHT3_9AGAM|nr:FMN-linked oxidoreductase [Fibularhizoctonia sp. CBS 109695]